MVLGVEFLEVHAGHKLLRGEIAVMVLLLRSSLLVLRGLGVQMMWVLGWSLVVVHHIPGHHLVVGVVVGHGAVHAAWPDHASGSLPHCLHAVLGAAVVHGYLSVGEVAHAGLGAVLRGPAHAHPEAMGVGHGHHHVVCHDFRF